jgi:hypothetical protein
MLGMVLEQQMVLLLELVKELGLVSRSDFELVEGWEHETVPLLDVVWVIQWE